jgi:hypothetical protein
MAQLAENAKVAGQLDSVGNAGEVSRHVAAGGLGKRLAGGEIQVDIAAQPVDRAALFMGNCAQCIPGGVFEKDSVVAVESIFIVNKAPPFGRVWMFRGCNMFYDYFFGIIYYSSLIIFIFPEDCTRSGTESKAGRGFRQWSADARAKRKPKRFKLA